MRHLAGTALVVLPLGLAAACTSNNGADVLDRPVAAAEGKVPAYCPNVSLREGTAILRKTKGEDLAYVASIAATSRECHIVDGELRMKIGIEGRVVPGPATGPDAVRLPIRIAVVRGADVLYSRQGEQQVSLADGTASTFVYVDGTVAVPEPTQKNLVIYAGFDEGPKA